jgi:hypothetical protein
MSFTMTNLKHFVMYLFPSHSGNTWQASNLLTLLFPTRSLCARGDYALPDHFLRSFRFSSQEQTLTPTTAIAQESVPTSEGAAENAISEQQVPSNLPDVRRSSRIRNPSLKLREIMDATALQSTIQVHVGFEAQLLLNVLKY